jgi:glycine/D-amino acid oxidase-like deaminating enzyme
VSHWLAELPDRPGRAPLRGHRDADVCIIGAGYTGLWTAYELRRADPSLEVVVLEARHAGFGASGRNGGWVLGELAGSRPRWIGRAGRGGARAMMLAIQQAVDEIGLVVAREGIACGYVKAGSLAVAQGEAQMRALREQHAQARELAIGEEDRLVLDADAVLGRVRLAGARGALFTPHCARVQPAKLARGLALATERAGATIHEQSPVSSIAPRLAVTASGSVRARWVVRATEGYTARLPRLRRTLLPLNSAMIVTEPLGSELWAQLGWERCETVRDAAHLYVYLQRTADGRVAIGGRGVPYRYASRTDREGPVPGRTVRELRSRLTSLFPPLRDAHIDRAWHGVLGVPRDWMPAVGHDRARGLAWAGGYAGDGVAAANLAGRTLCDLLLGRETELTWLPWVGGPGRPWEPEPLRFVGSRGVHAMLRAADALERRTGRPSPLADAANRLAGR